MIGEVEGERTVIAELQYEDGRAEIVRDSVHTWLVGSVADRRGTAIEPPEERRVVRQGVRGGRDVVGGLLPKGATRAVVMAPSGAPVDATCTGGAWLAIVPAGDGHDPPVRFDDHAGRPVRPPLPHAWTREPVDDATVACPACGRQTWDRVTPTDLSRGSRRRGDGPERPSPVIACTVCGHEEQEGSWYALPADHVPDPAAIERSRARRRDEQRRALTGIDFTTYAVADRSTPPELSSWGGGRRVTHVAVCHRNATSDVLVVDSASPLGPAIEDSLDRARTAFLDNTGRIDEPWPDLSRGALVLWLRARERERVAALAGAEPFRVEIEVDGAPVAFDALAVNGSWAAAANLDGAVLTITAIGWPLADVSLRSLHDPADEILPF
jgi:hypothetical protein